MTPRNPTNTDLSKQLADLSRQQADSDRRTNKRLDMLDLVVKNQEDNILAINKRHELIDAGKAAVDAYKKQESEDKRNQTRDGIANLQLKAWHIIVGVLGIISAIIYAIAATKGIKP